MTRTAPATRATHPHFLRRVFLVHEPHGGVVKQHIPRYFSWSSLSRLCHRKYRRRLKRTENAGKDGKENCLEQSRSFHKMQVEDQLNEDLNLGVSRPKRGFDPRWGHQENEGAADSYCSPFGSSCSLSRLFPSDYLRCWAPRTAALPAGDQRPLSSLVSRSCRSSSPPPEESYRYIRTG